MRSYRFGSFVLDVQERRLLCERLAVPLTPKVFDTLVYLVERHGHLVTKDELLEAVWGASHVEEGSLPRAIHVLRKTLNAAEVEQQRLYIETVPTKGYRFVADVTCVNDIALPPDIAVATERGDRDVTLARRPISWRTALMTVTAVTVLAFAGWFTRPAAHRDAAALPQVTQLAAQTGSGAAYVRFQSGRLHLERHLPGDDEMAVNDFEAALQLDPTFAAAYAGKADAKFVRYWDSGAQDDIAQARLAIRTAIELNRNSAYAQSVLCRLQGTYDWEFATAETTCRQAVALDPSNQEARRELAFLMNVVGKRDVALQEINKAVAIAPTSFNKRSRGVLLYFARRFDEAIAQLEQVEATDPEFVESSRWIARAFEQSGHYAEALEFLVRFRQSEGAGADEVMALRKSFASGGWRAVLATSLPAGTRAATLDTAGTLAQLGQLDAAFAVLESMIRARRVMIVHIDSEPRLDPLRSDPRFAQLASRVGLR
jgi:DNA-binding winged helix-turn-helix (wHTH) protein/Tfp pilus assembly protein PilF